jgi:hypothetical protein
MVGHRVLWKVSVVLNQKEDNVFKRLFKKPVATSFPFQEVGYMMTRDYRDEVHFYGLFASFEEAAEEAKNTSSQLQDEDDVAASDIFRPGVDGVRDCFWYFHDIADHSSWYIQLVRYNK